MSAIALPNFMIIGAPRCGTTALYLTIRQHPGIYMSPIKEPMFFAFSKGDPPLSRPAAAILQHTVRRPRDYLLLFAGATHQRAIGEASVIYLRTPAAARRIKATLPHCRLVVVLRNPVERAYSNYAFWRRMGLDRAQDVNEALSLERTHPSERDPFFLYTKMGYYAAQLRVYLDLFPREQIRIYTYEDWNETPAAMLKDLLSFLQVDDAVTLEPKRFNPPYQFPAPPPLAPALRAQLTQTYREDILQLQDLIERDLSHWLTPNGSL